MATKFKKVNDKYDVVSVEHGVRSGEIILYNGSWMFRQTNFNFCYFSETLVKIANKLNKLNSEVK